MNFKSFKDKLDKFVGFLGEIKAFFRRFSFKNNKYGLMRVTGIQYGKINNIRSLAVFYYWGVLELIYDKKA